ncbi:hypothetical protein CHARACLAT_017129 [Characodon lateralis]|uniref:Uncharacterized protein n=1 Tax=Characodon lateralis TaxID=208331 RepID=A0ABU7F487_9TELE|nr:hypothetical protein [Characodon lateralis]
MTYFPSGSGGEEEVDVVFPCRARLSVSVATWDGPPLSSGAALGCTAAEIDLSHPITARIFLLSGQIGCT